MIDYEKKYKEALARAKQVYSTPYTAGWDKMKDLIEHLFPEVLESEDEKIKKWLIVLLSTMEYHHCDEDREMGNKALAWLKSLRPQKLSNVERIGKNWKPSEEMMSGLNEAINHFADSPVLHENSYLYNILFNLREQLKAL